MLGKMFEGDSADMSARKFPLMSMGPRGGSSMRRPRIEDTHGRERKLTIGLDGHAGRWLEESEVRLTQPSIRTGQELGSVLIHSL
jgi:hypothetical protein